MVELARLTPTTDAQVNTIVTAAKYVSDAPTRSEGFDIQIVMAEHERRHFLTSVLASVSNLPEVTDYHKGQTRETSPHHSFFADSSDWIQRSAVLATAIVETNHYSRDFVIERTAAGHIEDPYLAMRVYNRLRLEGDSRSSEPLEKLLDEHVTTRLPMTNSHQALVRSFNVLRSLSNAKDHLRFAEVLSAAKTSIRSLSSNDFDGLHDELMDEEAAVKDSLIHAGSKTSRLYAFTNFRLVAAKMGDIQPKRRRSA